MSLPSLWWYILAKVMLVSGESARATARILQNGQRDSELEGCE
jgi:hypothetical protein